MTFGVFHFKKFFIISLVFFGSILSVFSQNFIEFSKKIPLKSLPYTTRNEFIDVSSFESEAEFTTYGLIPLTIEEAYHFIDEMMDENLESYYAIDKIDCLNGQIGIIYYQELFDTFDGSSNYSYLLVLYAANGQRISKFDLLGFEWYIENEMTLEDPFMEEEEEMFSEIEEDVSEIEVYHEEEINETNSEIADEFTTLFVDEGYAFSEINIADNQLSINRKSISYFTNEVVIETKFNYNAELNEFEEFIPNEK